MAHSSLVGISRADAEPAGRDNAALGPSDTSDSGSDVAGIAERDTADADLPIDVALRDDTARPAMPPDAASTDAAGTGESRSAAADAGPADGADIGVDRVFVPGLDDGSELIPEVDLDAVDADFAALADDGDEGLDLDDAAPAAGPPPGPGHPNPEPDVPATPVPGEGDNIPGGEEDDDGTDPEKRRPARDPLRATRLAQPGRVACRARARGAADTSPSRG